METCPDVLHPCTRASIQQPQSVNDQHRQASIRILAKHPMPVRILIAGKASTQEKRKPVRISEEHGESADQPWFKLLCSNRIPCQDKAIDSTTKQPLHDHQVGGRTSADTDNPLPLFDRSVGSAWPVAILGQPLERRIAVRAPAFSRATDRLIHRLTETHDLRYRIYVVQRGIGLQRCDH